MRMHLTRATIGALALVVAVALAGCEEDDGPGSAPPPDSPSVPDTSSPTEPSTSDAPEPLDPVEVVRAWVSAFNSTLRRGSEADAAAYEATDCWTCREHINPVIKALDRGGWFRGGRWSVTRARIAEQDASRASVYSAISAAGGTTLSRRGAEPTAYEEDKFILDFQLKRSSSGWLIAKIVYLS